MPTGRFYPVTNGTFGEGRHQISLIGPDGVLWESDPAGKDDLARELLSRLVPHMVRNGDDR